LRAVALGYDIGVRLIFALGFGKINTERNSTHSLATNFGATAAAAAMLRLDSRGVRHAFSFAAQQASGVPYCERDREHIEKAFDFCGMGARNGVTAATMIASGFTGVDDFLSGTKNLFTAVGGERPSPGEFTAELGERFEIMNTSIKKWTVGSPLQSVLDGMRALLEDPAVRAGKIRRVVVDLSAASCRDDARGWRGDLRQHSRRGSHERPQGVGNASPDRGRTEPGIGLRSASAPIDRVRHGVVVDDVQPVRGQ